MGEQSYLVGLVFLGGVLGGLALARLDIALGLMALIIAVPSARLLAQLPTPEEPS